jgi:hypothetical protein
MENPIEPLPFANASPVVPAMPVPVCLNPYCKGFSTKASIHCSVGAHRVKEGCSRTASRGPQCEGNFAWFPEILDRNALRNAWQTPVRYGGETKRTSGQLGRSEKIVESTTGQPGGCPSWAWKSWVMSVSCCFSCFSPADGLLLAGRAGSRLRSAPF